MARKPSSSRHAAEPRLPKRVTVRVELRYLEPPIWRELTVPDFYSLLQLHRCIQLAFDWLDYHLFYFELAGRRFARPEPDALGEDAGRICLADLGLEPGSRMLYLYDMGDGWEHDVTIRSLTPMDEEQPDPLGYVVDGARAAPPEDSGGPPGYSLMLQALTDPEGEDRDDLAAWLGTAFDPELFDLRAVNHAVVLASAWRVI